MADLVELYTDGMQCWVGFFCFVNRFESTEFRYTKSPVVVLVDVCPGEHTEWDCGHGFEYFSVTSQLPTRIGTYLMDNK